MAEIQSSDWELKWELLVADAWADPALKKRLMDDPAKVLAERGIAVPQGTQVKIIENTANVTHLVIPTKPAEGELSEEELAGVAGGHCGCGRCGCGRCGCGGCGGCGCGVRCRCRCW